MKFGPYADIQDCIAKNSKKASPEGFSAWLFHQVTGSWPAFSELKLSLPEAAWNIYIKKYSELLDSGEAEAKAQSLAMELVNDQGWFQSTTGWLRQYAAPSMRHVTNIRGFEEGKWTDSSGFTREWTSEDLDNMVTAFNDGVPAIVALKAGHTPDAFNEEIAKELGVPVKVITGDLGSGQITLGRMVSMEHRGNALFFGFDNVPDPIAALIENGQFNTVSVEISDKLENHGPVITAVAMLGAEEPSIASATLDRALVFGGSREGARVLSFKLESLTSDKIEAEFDTLKGKMNDTIKGMRGAPLFRALMVQLQKLYDQMVKGKHQIDPENPKGIIIKEDKMLETKGIKLSEFLAKFQINPEELIAIATELGLDETATLGELLEAMAKRPPAESPAVEEQAAAFSKISTEVKSLKHNALIHEYVKETSLLNHIEGKPEDIAETLATMEETVGKASAQSVLKTYQDANSIAEGATQVIGSSRPGEKAVDFENAVTEYSKAHPEVARVECIKITMSAHPDLYQAQVAENRSR